MKVEDQRLKDAGIEAGRMTRRRMLAVSGANALGVAMASWTGAFRAWGGQDSGTAGSPRRQPLNRFQRMVQEYYVEQLRRFEFANRKTLSELKTKAEAEKYVVAVREKIQACFGPFPVKSPLNPRVTGVVEREAYRIEKVIFESRPGFWVTGNLYLPRDTSEPRPAVLGLCGHSDTGKAAEAYQAFSQGLALQGYVVLIIDPIGQGERLQYPGADGASRVGTGVREHLLAGNQQFLVGEFFGAWRAWDAVRALDYLLTRSEVDPRHVGVTGNSGGGTMATWLCGLDARLTMAAPSCFVTTFRRNLENELPADTEQCPPRVLALGLDHEDFLAAMAPRPVLILGKEKDYFDARGTEEAYGRLKRLYGLLEAEGRLALYTGPTEHGYTQENREAMYRWFNGVTEAPRAAAEPEIALEKEETLWCTPRGQVTPLGSRAVPAFTRDHSRSLAQLRPVLEEKALAEAVAKRLRIPGRRGVPDYRILRPLPARGYPWPHATTYAVNTERGIHALIYRMSSERHLSRPPRGPSRAVLYVAHMSSDAELREEPLLRQLREEEPEAAFYTCDVRGVGESQPDTCGEDTFLTAYGSDYFYAIHSLMLDFPYAGQRTHDVLAVLDWLHSFGHETIHLAAKGWGAIPGVFASLLSPMVEQLTLKNALTSYAAVAESERYRWPLSSMVPGVLTDFDLPDCYRVLASRGLRLIEPWGPDMGTGEG